MSIYQASLNKVLTSFKTRHRHSTAMHLTIFYFVLSTILRGVFMIRSISASKLGITDVILIFTAGLLFDLTFICYAMIPATLFKAVVPKKILNKKWVKPLTFVFVFATVYGILFVTVAEWFFWDEFQARFNFIAVDYLVYTNEVVANVVESYPLFTILAVFAVLSGGVTYGYAKLTSRMIVMEDTVKVRWIPPLAFSCLGVICMIAIGQNLRTISENNYVRELSSNGPYQFFAAFRNNKLNYRQFYLVGDDQILSDRLKKIVSTKNVKVETTELFDVTRHFVAKPEPKKLNVILITVESLSAKYLTRFGHPDKLTPRIDQLMTESLNFTNHYATGTRTVRGLEALTLSLPPTPGRSTIKRPRIPVYNSFGSILQDNGYDTAFIYGGHGLFDNMNAFFSKQGYRIVDQGDITAAETTFSNAWGVCDEDLFNKTISEADKVKDKPFFFHLMTTSNHRPYTFPEGKIDAPQKHRSSAVKYTDFAIGKFIDDSREKAWFKDTLFVVIADHCASSAGRAKLNVLKYHIPLFIYCPAHLKPKEIDTLSSQMDVPPTILAILGISYDSSFFGDNILEQGFRPRALIGTYQKLGLLEEDRLLVLEPGKRATLLLPPWKTPSIKIVKKNDRTLLDAQAYYQGADYTLKHHLNDKNRQ